MRKSNWKLLLMLIVAMAMLVGCARPPVDPIAMVKGSICPMSNTHATYGEGIDSFFVSTEWQVVDKGKYKAVEAVGHDNEGKITVIEFPLITTGNPKSLSFTLGDISIRFESEGKTKDLPMWALGKNLMYEMRRIMKSNE